MIKIDHENLTFHLQTANSSYVMGVLDNVLIHAYYGRKLKPRPNQKDLLKLVFRPMRTYIEKHREFSLDEVLREYPENGFGDSKVSAFDVRTADSVLHYLEYSKSRIVPYDENRGNPLPFAHSKTWKTLEVTLVNRSKDLEVKLFYTPVEDKDIIVRHTEITNLTDKPMTIHKALSANYDFQANDFEILTLDGAWGRERHVHRHQFETGVYRIDSRHGISSAKHNPFIAMHRPGTTESHGETFGFTIAYSGNYEINVEKSLYATTRVNIGINNELFEWDLGGKETFVTPQAVVTYSQCGFNKMSQNFHNYIRDHVSPPQFSRKAKPIILNSWEAFHMHLNEEKMLKLAKICKDLTFEVVEIDDGWFGRRNEDSGVFSLDSIGDWWPNKEKFPNGLGKLSKSVRDMGMGFGIWFDAENVSGKSDLRDNHPDWVLGTKRGPVVHDRYQLSLDLSNPEVVQGIFDIASKAISENNVTYVRWDMNRPVITQDKLSHYHKHMLGVYTLLRKLVTTFPDVWFEGCSAGGHRMDIGILKFMSSIWICDTTDAFERMRVKYGTTFVYPLNVINSHVSPSPNQQIQRVTDMETRANVAYFGNLGYEFNVEDLGKFGPEIKKQIAFYRKTMVDLVQNGVFTRVKSPFEENLSAIQLTSQDGKEAVILSFRRLGQPNDLNQFTRFVNLEPTAKYQLNDQKDLVYGDELMTVGIPFSHFNKEFGHGDFISELHHVVRKN